MAVGQRRSRAELADGFRQWLLTNRPSWPDPQVEVTRPQSGLSSETVFVDVRAGTELHRLVARLPPRGDLLFPDYDLGQQFALQRALQSTAVPAAPALAHERDHRFVGSEFLLMPRIDGPTLTTAPPYVASGWLAEASADEQATVVRGFMRLLASIHRLPLAGLPIDPRPATLDYWDDYLTWATDDDTATKTYRDAIAWCREHQPAPTSTSLLWGDPQLVNVVFDDTGQVTAVLDWEMATAGPAEADLAWFLVLHEGAVETAGTDLSGFPPRDVLIGWYESELGRPVRDLAWYEVFAHLRSGAIVVRIAELMRRAGQPTGWTDHIPQPRHLRRLIEA